MEAKLSAQIHVLSGQISELASKTERQISELATAVKQGFDEVADLRAEVSAFVRLHQTVDTELSTLRHRQQRLEDRVAILEGR